MGGVILQLSPLIGFFISINLIITDNWILTFRMNPGRFGLILHSVTTGWTFDFAYCPSGKKKYLVTIIMLTLFNFEARIWLSSLFFFYAYNVR